MFSDRVSCASPSNGVNDNSTTGCFFLETEDGDGECHALNASCEAFETHETCESTENGAHINEQACVWVHMSDENYGCVNSASITDCWGYIDENACNSRFYLDDAKERGCLWSDNGCVIFKCDDYKSSRECIGNEKNVAEMCFWNGVGDSGSCKNYDDITSCSELEDVESCRKTKDNDSLFMNVQDCAWVRQGDVEECKTSTDIEDCRSFYLEPDCSGGKSYHDGSIKCLIYFILFIFFLFYFWL
jgi:hypothetical protein